MKRARDLMQTELVTVSPLDSLERVRALLSDEEIHGAPVVDEKGDVIGIVSLSDLIRPEPGASARAAPAEEIAQECVADVMTFGTARVKPDTPVSEVARKMRDLKVHRVLVMRGEELVGLVSSFDLLETLEDESPS